MFLIIAGNIIAMTLVTTAIIAFLGGGIRFDRKHRHRLAASDNVVDFPSAARADADEEIRRAA
jgi:hypothetical protein